MINPNPNTPRKSVLAKYPNAKRITDGFYEKIIVVLDDGTEKELSLAHNKSYAWLLAAKHIKMGQV